MTYQPKNYQRQGGSTWTVGGTLEVTTSGTLDVNGTCEMDDVTVNGTLTLSSGAAIVDTDGKWDDLRFPASAVRVPASGGPGVAAFIGTIQTLAFDADAKESIFIHAQMPHCWKKGSTISPHVHYATTATTGGAVVWGMTYTIAELNADFAAPTTDVVTASASTQHKLASFADIDMASYTGPSTMLLIELYRDSTAAADTHTTDARLLEFDIHFLRNSLGSSGEGSQGP